MAATGWPTKRQRDERGRQHRAEHETAERCAARVAEADGVVADRRHAAETWVARETEARQAHEARRIDHRRIAAVELMKPHIQRSHQFGRCDRLGGPEP